MVRHYVRKTNRADWSEEQMKLAIQSVQSKEMSIRKASASFGVPKDSLQRRVKGLLKNLPTEKLHEKKLGRYRTVLNEQEEKDLVEYILKMDEAFYGLSIMDIRRIVYDYAEKKNIAHPFSKQNKMAGRDFVKGFLARHPELSLRKPEGVALN